MTNPLKTRRGGLMLVAALAVLTLGGHLVTARTVVTTPPTPPTRPTPTTTPAITTWSSGQGATISAGARLDRTAVMEGGDGLVRMELVLTAAENEALSVQPTVPTDLLVVLDRSGSMQGQKLDHAKAAVESLVSSLGPDDRFALVSYSSGAKLSLPLERPDADARARWLRSVRIIRATGGTNMSSGLDLALSTLEADRKLGRAVRVILISDGLANEGDSSPQGLAQRASLATREEYVLSAVGVGNDFNESLMSQLADAGTGNFYYLQDARELASVFADEFQSSRTTVASGVAVNLTPANGVEVVDAAGYPLEQRGSGVTFRPGSMFGGQERRIWISYRVPNARPGEHSLGSVAVSWSEGADTKAIELSEQPKIACVRDEARYLASVDRDIWADSQINEVYNELKEEVADFVKSGRKEEALGAIEHYRQETERLNSYVQSPSVNQNVHQLEEDMAEVEEAFTGKKADQARKQNMLSKSKRAEAWDGRRSGAKQKQQDR